MRNCISAVFFVLACSVFMSCGAGSERRRIKVVNWNVQTFFDSENDGSEYSEFVKCAAWGKERYVERLKRLTACLRILDADVIVMEEIESMKVLHDISNFLAGEWNQNKIYSWGCFARNEGSAIGCGVLSRIPLEGLKVHSMDIRSEYEEQPRLRPVMEVNAVAGKKALRLLVNHWKSKSGGEEKTEKWRNREESVLASLVSGSVSEGIPVLAVGDFNRDIMDFSVCEGGETALCGFRGNVVARMKSLWFSDGEALSEPGSYWFSGSWSRIDNFFVSGPVSVLDFSPCTEGPWCSQETGIPRKYSLWSGEGYSDHLPIMCLLEF